MKFNKYKIVVENDGVNHVRVIEAKGDAWANYWHFPLKGDNEPIIISEFFNQSQFVLINRCGWIRAWDADSKELLLDFKLNGKINSSAVLALDESKVYISFQHTDSKYYMATCMLDTFVINMKELPANLGDTIQIRNDGNLLFYKHDVNYVNNVYTHGYTVIDVVSNSIQQFDLPYAPQFSFDNFKPVIHLERNICIVPIYDQVFSKQNDDGEPVFEFKIALIDLTTFQVLNELSVRDFSISQFAGYESECQDMVNAFSSANDRKQYLDAVKKFYSNLTSIQVTVDGFWLCWRGGILRKVYNDNTMSPILVTSKISNSTLEGTFAHTFFHPSIYQISQSEIVLEEEPYFYQTSLPEFDALGSKEVITLELQKKTKEEIWNLSNLKKNKKEISKRNLLQINVNNLSTEQSFIVALIQIETMVAALESFGIDKTLVFVVKDSKGNVLLEPEFFSEAIKYEKAPEHLKAIVKKISQSPKIKYLHRSEEETALCYAVLELARLGEPFLTTVLDYLAKIDLGHDVFNREFVIPVLEQLFEKEYLIKRIKSVSDSVSEWYLSYCEEKQI